MSNSTIKLSQVVANAKLHPDLSPVVQSSTGGLALEPALTIANQVMTTIISQNFNWKWNRFKYPLFYTNSFQQDYARNVLTLGWLENGVLLDINNTSTPKPIWPMEVVKDLPMTSTQYGMPGQVCWFPNDQLRYGTWSDDIGADTTITDPVGSTTAPSNPITQIKDSNGNFWYVTTYGTTGSSEPTWTNPPVYPTVASPDTAASTVTDGTVVWTALNPKAAGIRCNPIPPQTGVVFEFNLFAQYRPFSSSDGPFTSLSSTIEPIPDDFAKYFYDGFVALAYGYSPDKALRGKSIDMWQRWMMALDDAKKQGDRERDNNGFYPATSMLQQPFTIYPGPAYPYPLPWG